MEPKELAVFSLLLFPVLGIERCLRWAYIASIIALCISAVLGAIALLLGPIIIIRYIRPDPFLDPIVATTKCQAHLLHPDMRDFKVSLSRIWLKPRAKPSDCLTIRFIKCVIAEVRRKEGDVAWVAVLRGDRPEERWEPGKPWGPQVIKESRRCESEFGALTVLECLLDGELLARR